MSIVWWDLNFKKSFFWYHKVILVKGWTPEIYEMTGSFNDMMELIDLLPINHLEGGILP